MELDPEIAVSTDSFEKYGLNQRCRISNERVQDFIDRGLMSEAIIYQRYTEKLSEELTSARRSDRPTVIVDIKAAFQRLRDPVTSCIFQSSNLLLIAAELTHDADLSPDLFEQQITNHLQSLFVTLPQETSRTLFSILSFHAVYPFSQQTQKSGVSEDAFIRAICLLTLSPFPFQGPTARATHSYYSGTWGPYHGRYIARRGRDASDFLRRVFRSLTLSSSTSRRSEQYTKQPGHMTMLQVPRFSYYEPTVTGEDHEGSEDEASKEIVVVEDERETDIDIIDVLSECPPEEDRRTANPFRKSYRIVLPSLPRHEEDLMDLFVPTSRLVGLMQLLSGAQTSRTVDWAGAMESASIDGKMGWKEFEHTMAEHSGSLADRLSKVFGAFIVMKH